MKLWGLKILLDTLLFLHIAIPSEMNFLFQFYIGGNAALIGSKIAEKFPDVEVSIFFLTYILKAPCKNVYNNILLSM